MHQEGQGLAAGGRMAQEAYPQRQFAAQVEAMGGFVRQRQPLALRAAPEPFVAAGFRQRHDALQRGAVLFMEGGAQAGVAFQQVAEGQAEQVFVHRIEEVQREGQVEDGAEVVGGVGAPQRELAPAPAALAALRRTARPDGLVR